MIQNKDLTNAYANCINLKDYPTARNSLIDDTTYNEIISTIESGKSLIKIDCKDEKQIPVINDIQLANLIMKETSLNEVPDDKVKTLISLVYLVYYLTSQEDETIAKLISDGYDEETANAIVFKVRKEFISELSLKIVNSDSNTMDNTCFPKTSSLLAKIIKEMDTEIKS